MRSTWRASGCSKRPEGRNSLPGSIRTGRVSRDHLPSDGMFPNRHSSACSQAQAFTVGAPVGLISERTGQHNAGAGCAVIRRQESRDRVDRIRPCPRPRSAIPATPCGRPASDILRKSDDDILVAWHAAELDLKRARAAAKGAAISRAVMAEQAAIERFGVGGHTAAYDARFPGDRSRQAASR